MPLLNQKDIAGTSHIKPLRIVIENDLDSTPTITYELEKVITVAKKTVTKRIPDMTVELAGGVTTPLRDPSTGDLLGPSINRSMLITALFSFLWEDYLGDE